MVNWGLLTCNVHKLGHKAVGIIVNTKRAEGSIRSHSNISSMDPGHSNNGLVLKVLKGNDALGSGAGRVHSAAGLALRHVIPKHREAVAIVKQLLFTRNIDDAVLRRLLLIWHIVHQGVFGLHLRQISTLGCITKAFASTVIADNDTKLLSWVVNVHCVPDGVGHELWRLRVTADDKIDCWKILSQKGRLHLVKGLNIRLDTGPQVVHEEG
mmetsp:Transcript_43590/g.70771  ORF Transcript_43590/g.70771 Transcript_43590/m.70771 type:complete len:211 (+) Transcript_43590:1534-2166(+)